MAYREQVLGGRLMYAGLLLLHVCNVVDRRVELRWIVINIHDVDDNGRQVRELVIEHAVLQAVYLSDNRTRVNNIIITIKYNIFIAP